VMCDGGFRISSHYTLLPCVHTYPALFLTNNNFLNLILNICNKKLIKGEVYESHWFGGILFGVNGSSFPERLPKKES
jgi:hypothetical protein